MLARHHGTGEPVGMYYQTQYLARLPNGKQYWEATMVPSRLSPAVRNAQAYKKSGWTVRLVPVLVPRNHQ